MKDPHFVRLIRRINWYPPYLGKNTCHFSADLVDRDGTVVALVKKELYVRAKGAKPASP